MSRIDTGNLEAQNNEKNATHHNTSQHAPTLHEQVIINEHSPFHVGSWGLKSDHSWPGYGPLNLEAGNEVAGGKALADG